MQIISLYNVNRANVINTELNQILIDKGFE
jgi:hypothetical protein